MDSLRTRILQTFEGQQRMLLSSEESSVFEACSQQLPDGNSTSILECISDTLEAKLGVKDSFSRDEVHFLLVLSGALIFFMQAGFAMLCAGCVQTKNVQNTMLKNLLDACGSAIAFFFIGKVISCLPQSIRAGDPILFDGSVGSFPLRLVLQDTLWLMVASIHCKVLHSSEQVTTLLPLHHHPFGSLVRQVATL